MVDDEFIQLRELVLEDTPEKLKIRQIHPNEGHYGEVLGGVELALYSYSLQFPIRDSDVVNAVERLLKEPLQEVNDDNSLFFALVYGLSHGIQNQRISLHELELVLKWVLWCIDNRSYFNDDKAYLNYLSSFFGNIRKKYGKTRY